jgi:hypothetical protein
VRTAQTQHAQLAMPTQCMMKTLKCCVMSQVALNVVTLAFLVVASTCAMLIPVMLYIFWLKPSGWQWYDAALFGSIIASTDAVAIVAVLKKSARPTCSFPFACWCLGDGVVRPAGSTTCSTALQGLHVRLEPHQKRPQQSRPMR